jgi:hypothetical protein
MADGDIIIDMEFELDESSGHRVKLFACEDSTRPGDVKYRFQYFDPRTGETILRYDNSHHHPEADWHHRHRYDEEPDPIEFEGLRDHIDRFRQEVRSINE